jgi:hypothetical protein
LSSSPLPTVDVKLYIAELARRHGTQYVKTQGDAMAGTITRLAGDNAVMDEVELLLIALERAGIVPREAVVPLHVNYLREKLQVNTETARSFASR